MLLHGFKIKKKPDPIGLNLLQSHLDCPLVVAHKQQL